MCKAIKDFAKSVGLKSRFDDSILAELLIPNECFTSEDNKLILTAVFVGDKKFTQSMIGHYADSIDRINHKG